MTAAHEAAKEETSTPHPTTSLYTWLRSLASDGYVRRGMVPLDRSPFYVDDSIGMTRLLDSRRNNLAVRLVGIVFGPDGDLFSLGQAEVSNLDCTQNVGYFASRPPERGRPYASLIGVVGIGFPLVIEGEGSNGRRAADPWQLEVSENPDHQLVVRERAVPDGYYQAEVYTAANNTIKGRGAFVQYSAFWAPQPSELAHRIRNQATAAGETALMAAVYNDPLPTDRTAVMYLGGARTL